MKKALIVVGVLLVLVIAALFAVPPLLGWDFVKTRVAEAVKAETGHDLEIGDISVQLLPSITAELSDLRVTSALDAVDRPLLTLGKLDLALALLPLFGKSVEVDRLVVQDLALNLQVNDAGQANWTPRGSKPQAAASATPKGAKEKSSEPGAADFPLSNLVLGDVRLTNGRISYQDALSGQSIAISNAGLKASLPGLSGRFDLNGGMVVNEQQVTLDFGLDSPEALLRGEAASLKSDLASPLLSLVSDLRLQSQPQPAVDGQARLEIVSVGELLDWLQRPLPAEQPDPGSVSLAASFKTEGAKVILEEATLMGDALEAKANGSLDVGGEVTKVSLLVESGELDIDRYLPPPVDKPGAERPRHSGKKRASKAKDEGTEGLSDEPFDLAALKTTEADIRVVVGGIKAAGYQVGPIDFTAVMQGGLLEAELVRLALYGGDVTGKARLDATGDAAAVNADFNLDQVDLGALSAVGAEGPAPVAGVASASLTATGTGASPKSLVQDLKGGLTFKLGKLDVANAPAAALSGADIAVDLPGLANPPSLKGNLVYNKEEVSLGLTMDPLDKLLAGDSFALEANVSSSKLMLSYDGSIQQRPLPGLDGNFLLDVPSVGALSSWLGNPLPEGQPDPGPLKVTAVLRADGGKVALQQASIEGDQLSARASGEVEVAEEATSVTLDVNGGFLDIDRYLPAPEKKAAKKSGGKAKRAAAAGGPRNILAELSSEPIDLAAFEALNADIKIALEGVKSGGIEVAPVKAEVAAKDGVLTLDLTELGLYGGTVTSHASVKEVKDSLDAEFALNMGGLAVGDLLKAAGNETPPASGIAALAVTAKTVGTSPRALVEGLVANLSASLDQAALTALPDGTIDKLQLDFDLPALAEAAKGRLDLRLNGEAAALALDLDTPEKALSGETFGLRADLNSDHLTAKVDGTLQQAPLPGFAGKLAADASSLARLAAWLGHALPKDQPDPGGLSFSAEMSAAGEKLSLESLSLDGKAVKITGKGSFDGSGELAKFNGMLDIANLDLNVYLPPESASEPKKSAGGDGAASGGGKAKKPAESGWSEKPFKLKALRQAEGNIKVKSGPITYRQVKVQDSSTTVALAAGVMTASVNRLNFDKGRATANAVVDASKKAAGFKYEVSLKGIESKPFLASFADIDWMSGLLAFDTKGTATGRNQKEVVESLNGDGAFKFKDGAIEGFDLAGTLRQANALGLSSLEGSDRPKTEFTELGGSYSITDGLFENGDLKMLAPLVRVTGAGIVDLPPRTLDYQVEAKLVGSLEGQGGDEALAGLPIPIHASGPWDSLKFDIDWKTVLSGAALDPERLENLPSGLSDAAKGLGLVIPGATSGGDGGSSDAGDTSLEGAVGGALNQFLGGGGDKDAASEEAAPKKKKKKKKKKKQADQE